MCRTTPSTGTLSSPPGFRSMGASIGSRGYDAREAATKHRALRGLHHRAAGLGPQHAAWADSALFGVRHAAAVARRIIVDLGIALGCGRLHVVARQHRSGLPAAAGHPALL